MSEIITVVPDLAKNVFQAHVTDADGKVIRRSLLLFPRLDQRSAHKGLKNYI